jgi:hypothetical protein
MDEGAIVEQGTPEEISITRKAPGSSLFCKGALTM